MNCTYSSKYALAGYCYNKPSYFIVFPTNEFAMKVGAGLKTIECLCNYHYYSISRISVIPNYNTEYSLIRTFDSLEKAKNYFSKINGLMAII